MGSWRKLLKQMEADDRPRGYTYDQAASILLNLGFVLARPMGGSHRKFRLVVSDTSGERRTVVIGLVDSGKGTMKAVYIKSMIATLRQNRLLEEGV